MALNVKPLSVPQLLALREEIDQQLELRKSELQAQLAQIGGGARGSNGRSAKSAKVAPKYRHPVSGETWTGRGGVAGWLAQELKAGKKREDFLIIKPGKTAGKKTVGKSTASKAGPAKKAAKKTGRK